MKTKKGLTVLLTALFVAFISVGLYGCTQKTQPAKKVTAAPVHQAGSMMSNGMKMAAPTSKSKAAQVSKTTAVKTTAGKVVKKVNSKKLEAAAMKIIHAQSCLSCHVINGKGGSIGPALSKEGAKGHSVNWLEVQINTPKVHSPNTMMPNHNLNATQLKTVAEYLNSLK